jgi:hypothetical protein
VTLPACLALPCLVDLKKYLALAVSGNEPLEFTPLLLLGEPGKVAQALVVGDYANPVMVLDEVDKAGGDAKLEKRDHLLVKDIDSARAGRGKPKMGF